MRIALDAMGGDRAPQVVVAGAAAAAREGVEVLLVGDEAQVRAELARLGADLPVWHAPDHIRMEEAATEVRRRPQASVRVAMELLKRGEVQAVVSMGHSGATLAAALTTTLCAPALTAALAAALADALRADARSATLAAAALAATTIAAATRVRVKEQCEIENEW